MISRRSRKPTESAPRSSPFQRIGTPTPERTPSQHDVAGERHVVVVGGRHHRPPGREHPAGDALAGRQPVAEPLVGAVVAGGRERGAVRVEQVDAGHLPADGEVGLARQRVEHGLQLERHVQRVGGARERLVALGLREAALLGLQPREAERRLVGERLGDQDLVGRPDVRAAAREDGDVAHVARPRDRDEQRVAGLQPRRRLDAQLGHDARLVERERARGRDDLRRARAGAARAAGPARAPRRGRPSARCAPRPRTPRAARPPSTRTGPPPRGGAAGRARRALGSWMQGAREMTAFGRRV